MPQRRNPFGSRITGRRRGATDIRCSSLAFVVVAVFVVADFLVLVSSASLEQWGETKRVTGYGVHVVVVFGVVVVGGGSSDERPGSEGSCGEGNGRGGGGDQFAPTLRPRLCAADDPSSASKYGLDYHQKQLPRRRRSRPSIR